MLCSVENIYTYLKRTDTDPSTISLEEEQWLALIDSTTTKIENITNRTFAETSYIEFADGTGNRYLFTEQFPIISLTSIDLVNIDESSVSAVDISTDIRIDYTTGQLFKVSNWISGESNYKITYSAGFATIPDDLNLICVQEVLKEAAASTINSGLSSEKIGDYSYSLNSSAENDKQLKSKLQKYINNY